MPVPQELAAIEPPVSAPEVYSDKPVQLEPGTWADMIEVLGLGGMVHSVASHCELRQVDGDKAFLVLDETNAALYHEGHAERIGQSLQAYLGRQIEVAVEIGVPRYETPAARARRLLDERLAQAVEAIEADPKVRLLLDRFEGTLDRESITPIKH